MNLQAARTQTSMWEGAACVLRTEASRGAWSGLQEGSGLGPAWRGPDVSVLSLRQFRY